MKIKWAQMTPLERAWLRLEGCEGRYKFSGLFKYPQCLQDKQYHRQRNRYYQLLKHWCKLKKETESNTTANS